MVMDFVEAAQTAYFEPQLAEQAFFNRICMSPLRLKPYSSWTPVVPTYSCA